MDLWLELASGEAVTVQVAGTLDLFWEGMAFAVAHGQLGELEADPDPSDDTAAVAIRVRFNLLLADGFESGDLTLWPAGSPPG